MFDLAFQEKKKSLLKLKKIDHFYFDKLIFQDIKKSMFGNSKIK